MIKGTEASRENASLIAFLLQGKSMKVGKNWKQKCFVATITMPSHGLKVTILGSRVQKRVL